MSERTVFQGKKIRVITMPVDDIPAFEVVRHPGAVAVVAYDKDFVYLTQQYRPAIDKKVIELVAGTREIMEEPFETAKRELAEEIGFEADEWIHLADFYSSPGYCDEEINLWAATRLHVVEQPEADDSGLIEPIAWPLDGLDYLIESAETAKTLAGLLLLKAHLAA